MNILDQIELYNLANCLESANLQNTGIRPSMIPLKRSGFDKDSKVKSFETGDRAVFMFAVLSGKIRVKLLKTCFR